VGETTCLNYFPPLASASNTTLVSGIKSGICKNSTPCILTPPLDFVTALRLKNYNDSYLYDTPTELQQM